MTEEQSIYDERWKLVLRHAEQLDLLKERVAALEQRPSPTATGSGIVLAALALSAVVDVVRNNDISAGLLGLLYDADDRFRRALAATDRELGQEHS